MAFGTRIERTEQVKFEEIGKTGVFLARVEADPEKSMRLLKEGGFNPLIGENIRNPSKEDITKVLYTCSIPEVLSRLKGFRFYLGGIIKDTERFSTLNDQEFIEGKGDIEKTVYVFSCSQPLALEVFTDDYARFLRCRFALSAIGSRGAVRTVVGVRASHEVAAPKTEATQARRH